MNDRKRILVLIGALVISLALFVVLYLDSLKPVEKDHIAPESTLSEWTIENSDLNGAPLKEDKGIYELDANLYDVYINVFPTEDSSGEMLTFRSFDLHQSRDHTYNPVLDCNIQILEPGQIRDPLYQDSLKNATIRVRGNSSRGDTYKSYKVTLDDDAAEFRGQKTFNINKHSEDVMKVSAKISADMLAEIPSIASYRTYFFRVWICDASLPKSEQQYKYYGLYTDFEQPNKSYLRARGLYENAVMYKAVDFSFNYDERLKNVDDPDYDEELFEQSLRIREGSDHSKLLEMLDAVNDMSRDFREIFDTYFNEDNFLTWLSFNLLIGDGDILDHNYIFYSPENARTWYFFVWDLDEGFVTAESIAPSLRSIQKLNLNTLCRRYFQLSGSLEKIEAKMRELLDEYMTDEKVNALADAYMPVLEQTIPLEPDIGLLSSRVGPNELEGFIRSRHAFFEENFQQFLEATQYPAPMYVDMPKKNADGTLYFAWEPSFSYQERTITYNITVADDYDMDNVLFEQKGLLSPSCTSDVAFAPGTYYVLVTAVDSEGNEQYSIEHYEQTVDGLFTYKNGVLQFTVE